MEKSYCFLRRTRRVVLAGDIKIDYFQDSNVREENTRDKNIKVKEENKCRRTKLEWKTNII